jgi:hypothetical protein
MGILAFEKKGLQKLSVPLCRRTDTICGYGNDIFDIMINDGENQGVFGWTYILNIVQPIKQSGSHQVG